MGQVFHAHAETHARVISHCKTNGVGVKTFVDAAINAALEGRAPKAIPVEKKRGQEFTTDKSEGPKPWELPPFWARPAPTPAATEPTESVEVSSPAKVDEDEEEDDDPPRTTNDAGGGNVAAAIGEPYQPISEKRLLGA